MNVLFEVEKYANISNFRREYFGEANISEIFESIRPRFLDYEMVCLKTLSLLHICSNKQLYVLSEMNIFLSFFINWIGETPVASIVSHLFLSPFSSMYYLISW
jgi:hypothetical protein